MKNLNILNFRDIKGYKNCYGEIMKPLKIFRGAALDSITIEEIEYMENELGIHYIFDFRDEKEAAASPDVQFPNAIYKRISAMTVSNEKFEGFDIGTILNQGMDTKNIQLLSDYIDMGYEGMPFHNKAYKEMFDALLKGDGNIYFHCSAGKDRTGIAGFLIMIALGMSEKDAIYEYLLSNAYLKNFNDVLCEKINVPKELRTVVQPLLGVCIKYIESSIHAIKCQYSDYEEFLESEYQLTEEKRKKLRKIYCE